MRQDSFKTICQRFIGDESGATAIEYALLAAAISVAIIASTATMGNHIADDFVEIEDIIERQDLNTGHVDD